MRLSGCLLAVLAAPLPAFAVPMGKAAVIEIASSLLLERQLKAPPPCVRMNPPPTQNVTDARFADFVEAFVGKSKNITKAFEYIAADYINHNPAARNGSESAWSILSPIWQSTPITYLRSTIQGNMSWVNYRAGGIGEVVDRFRWEAGCIVEHWDQGEKYPTS